MNIVFVTPSFKTGGGNRVFIELANQLCYNKNVLILAPNNSESKHTFNLNELIKIVLIGRLAKNKFTKIFNIFKVVHFLNTYHKNDIIICSDPLFCLFMPLIKSPKLYRFIQADDYRIFDDGMIIGKGIALDVYKKICLISYRNKRIKYIFNSTYVYENYCHNAQRFDVPFLLVHPALNRKIFNSNSRSKSTSQIVISLVARKHPSKGLSTFINVWKDLSCRYKKAVSKVILISHDDLSCFDTDGMDIVVPKSDMDIVDVYRKSDVFISTSWREGFGLPPLEAMACGCAVICSDAGGINEYARKDNNCLIFKPKDELALKQALIRVIEDENLRNTLMAEGIESTMAFTWENSAKQLLDIIN